MKQLERYRDIAIKAADIGSKILLEHFKNISSYDVKKNAGFVTKADTDSEKAISEFLNKETPDFGILAEEDHSSNSKDKWIIDPLDGTTNFFHHVPHFNISIALEMDGEIVIGVICNPVTKEIYHCIKGGGAYKNKERIYVSKTKVLSTSILGTGFAYMSEQELKEALDIFLKFSLKCHGIRRFGAAALDICYVAAGIYDGFYERTLSPWDVAAGSLLISEAGGKLTDYSGGKFSIYGRNIVASNNLIHKEILETLKH